MRRALYSAEKKVRYFGGNPKRTGLLQIFRRTDKVGESCFSTVQVNHTAAAQAAALDSSGIIVDPYEPSLVKSTVRRRVGHFMLGLGASTQLTPVSNFKAKDFNKDHGIDIMRQFYHLYGIGDRDGLKSIVTAPLYAKLKAKMRAEDEQAGRKGRGKGKRSRAQKRNSASKREGTSSHPGKAIGFKLLNVPKSAVVQVRTLRGLDKKEIAFGQVTSEMEILLAPVQYDNAGNSSVVPFEPPFGVVPGPERWRRAVDDKGQIYFWNTATNFTQWQQPIDYAKITGMLPPYEVSADHYMRTAASDEYPEVVVVRQLPVFELAALKPNKRWKLAGFAM